MKKNASCLGSLRRLILIERLWALNRMRRTPQRTATLTSRVVAMDSRDVGDKLCTCTKVGSSQKSDWARVLQIRLSVFSNSGRSIRSPQSTSVRVSTEDFDRKM